MAHIALAVTIVQVHNFVDRASNTRGGLGCETTTSTGLSRLPTSLLSHCSHGGHFFTPETFVNDDRAAVAACGGGLKGHH
jgi:hypothetical protein